MTRAQDVTDAIVREVASIGFEAFGLRVRFGDHEAHHDWEPDVRRDVHSIAKGVCVLATAVAADGGVIGFDEPIASLLPEVEYGAGTGDVTLRHLLTMTSGVDFPWSPTLMTDWPDLAHEFLRRPSRGRVFQYSNASTYTAMRVLETRVGDVGSFIDRTLLTPLDILDTHWRRCPNGFIEAGAGLAMTTAELARVGRLIRDRGHWRGEQLVSPGWVDAMHSDWVAAGSSPGYDRYALAGWDGPGSAWRLHGAYGQLLVFVGDAVVTITARDHERADDLAAAIERLLGDATGATR